LFNLLDLVTAFKLTLPILKKKKPNIFQLANIKSFIQNFEEKHKISPGYKSRAGYSKYSQGTIISVDSENEHQSVPSYQFFVSENVVESLKSSIVIDDNTSQGNKSELERASYIEFRIPKSWIDEVQHGRKDQIFGMKRKRTILKSTAGQSSRTTKLSLGIIKAKLKLSKLLQRVRNKLKNAEYYHVFLKTTISYQKLSDGSYIRALTIQDIVQQGFNKANIAETTSKHKKQNLDRKYTLEVSKATNKADPKNRRHT